ncbi:MAG: hypothetical protein OXG98_11315 [Gemmatimonadetes bacterium]|nr:hypothetical protein [Gemmatimonadota bacterium]
MEFWSTLWAVVFVLCLLLFAVVAVYVSVGALGDIRALFRRMGRRDGEA